MEAVIEEDLKRAAGRLSTSCWAAPPPGGPVALRETRAKAWRGSGHTGKSEGGEGARGLHGGRNAARLRQFQVAPWGGGGDQNGADKKTKLRSRTWKIILDKN